MTRDNWGPGSWGTIDGGEPQGRGGDYDLRDEKDPPYSEPSMDNNSLGDDDDDNSQTTYPKPYVRGVNGAPPGKLEVPDKCDWCGGANISVFHYGASINTYYYPCGTKWDWYYNRFERSNECYESEVARLQAVIDGITEARDRHVELCSSTRTDKTAANTVFFKTVDALLAGAGRRL